MSARRRYLVCYDIRDPARLRAVHATLKSRSEPLQYSVFVCDLDKRELLALRFDLGQVIHHQYDRVLLVDLGEEDGPSRFSFMGQAQPLPHSGPTIV